MIISVIVPCYNVESVVDRCLESIVCQTIGIENLEIICINDASTDGTLARLKVWEEKYSENILLIDCPVNGHLGTARNTGVQYSTCDWLAFIDSDDWIEPDYLEKMYQITVNKPYEIVSCGFERDSSKELIYFNKEKKLGNDCEYIVDSLEKRKEFFHTQPMKLYAWGKLIKKEFLLNNNIFFPDHLAYEDIYWGNLVNMYVKYVYVLDQKLYHYYVNDSSLVLRKNSMHHIDHLTVQEMMWDEWIRRGFFNEFKDELEFEYIYNGYLAFLKILVYRYDETQYSLFQLLQVLTAKKIQNVNDNYYVKNNMISEIHKNYISFIGYKISKDQFIQMVENIKKLGI